MNSRSLFDRLIIVFMTIMLVIFSSSFSFAVNSYSDEDYEENLKKDEGMFASASEGIAYMIRGIGFGIFRLVQKGFASDNDGKYITIDDLVFDHFGGTSIDFYGFQGSEGKYTGTLKDNITDWYNRFSTITTAFYGFLLLYIGVNIMLAVGGKKQERYKEMLLVWLESILLFALFPYLLKFVMKVNTTLAQAVEKECSDIIGSSEVKGNFDDDITPKAGLDAEKNESIGDKLVKNPFSEDDTSYMAVQANRADKDKGSITDALIFLIMVFQFILLLIVYYKRMFLVSFLITLFPIVMIFYPIDKLNDGKSQSFSVWSKELFVNIFTQCFHAVAYVFCLGVAQGSAGNDWILSIVGITFLFKAEEIIKTILGVGGTKTAVSPAKEMMKAAATVGVVNKIGQKVTSTATNFVEGARDIKHAYDAGWRFNFGITSAQRNRATQRKVEENFDRMLALEHVSSGSTDGPTSPPINMASLPSDGEGETSAPETNIADNMADIILNAEDEQVISVTGLDADGVAHDKMGRLGQAAAFTLENLDSGQFALALEQHGLTGDMSGKKSATEIKKAVGEMIEQVSNLNPNDKEYKEKVKQINYDFQQKIQVALPGLSLKGAMKYSQELMNVAVATGGTAGWNKIKGKNNNKNAYTEEEPLNSSSVRDTLARVDRKINGASAVADFSTLDERKRDGAVIFSTKSSVRGRDGSVALRGQAAREKDAILDAMENDSTLKKQFADVSQTQKAQIAHRLAVLKTFSAQSKLSTEEMNANVDRLSHETAGSSGMQLFTAAEVQEAAEFLKKQNHMTNGAVDSLLTGSNADVSLGASADEVQKIIQETTLVYGQEAEETGVLIDSKGNVEKITDANRKQAQDADKAFRKAAKRATERQKKTSKGLRKAEIKRRDPVTGEMVEEVVELYEDSYTGSTIDQVINISRVIRVQMDEKTQSERETYRQEGYDFTNGVAKKEASRAERAQKLFEARMNSNGPSDRRSAAERIASRASKKKVPKQSSLRPSVEDAMKGKKIESYTQQGSSVIYPERAEEWATWASTGRTTYNDKDKQIATAVMKKLDGGASLEEIDSYLNTMNCTSGDMYNEVRAAVFRFSKRGPEFYEHTSGGTMSDSERLEVDTKRKENEQIEASIRAAEEIKARSAERLKAQQQKDAMDREPKINSDPLSRENLFATEAERVVAARQLRFEENMAKVALSSELQTFGLDAERVNGMTKDEMMAQAIRLKNQGARKMTKAATTVLTTAAAGLTVGPMAIGLNTGADPVREYVAGTFLAQAGMEKAMIREKTVTIKDEFGEEIELKIDPYSSDSVAITIGNAVKTVKDLHEDGARALVDLVLTGSTSTLSINDLRDTVGDRSIMMDIEGQLAQKSVEKQRKFDDANMLREDEIRAKKIGKFSDALNGKK